MTEASSGARPIFDPVDTSFDPSDVCGKDDVESPSLTSGNALARFEFEPGKSRDGTKVLMVEWEEDDVTKTTTGDWEVRWEGKKTVLPAREQGADAAINRLYFLLGPGVSVPTTVKLQKGSITWRTNPLPAIFNPELGATARQAGKKGVLHTIWAKKRLQVLSREIDNESKNNAEGLGFEMAIAERDWIEQNFGVSARAGSIAMQGSIDPSTPRSPGGGRLMEKLKGLKIGTDVQELQPSSKGSTDSYQNPLSPETSDVAVGGFGSFSAIKGPQSVSPTALRTGQSPRKVVPLAPPESLAAHSRQQPMMGSLNAFASSDNVLSAEPEDDKQDDDLFALPMSPRTGAETRSPFSFGAQDTTRYLKSETA